MKKETKKNKLSSKIFNTEREGQLHFFNNFGINLGENDVLIANTDGVYHGNIFEFKLSIKNTQQVLFQAIKYLSRLRITGKPVPQNILLVSLNQSKIYIFDSGDYLKEIHKSYYGGASKNNDGFTIRKQPMEIDYSTDVGADKISQILKENNFTKIKIDETCIWAWSEKYYLENPKATKADFLGDEALKNNIKGEIREPNKFKEYILPYTNKTNIEFDRLMDCLNDRLSKKELGAFFTPPLYAKKAVELVRKAIKLVPKGNDYIILDRCAGTGNLQVELSDEELSHTIVSTYEYYEWRILKEKIGNKVRSIIPPTEQNVIYQSGGKISNGDALTEEFLNNEIIKKYIDNPKCTIILFENPPYSDSSADNNTNINRQGSRGVIYNKFKENISDNAAHRDLSNLFIWSGFKYYLRQPTDSYILFSPVKYFKSINLVQKTFCNGFLFNRNFFHASPSAISVIHWKNVDKKQDEFVLSAFNIIKNISGVDSIQYIKDIVIRKVYKNFTTYQDKRASANDTKGICVDPSGVEIFDFNKNKIPIYNKNIIGYMFVKAFPVDVKHRGLFRCIERQCLNQSYGFYLRSDNYLLKLPLFVAKLYPQDKWYEKDVYFTTADDGDKYTKDKDLLKSCFIFTCLSRYNKCLSFTGSDKRFYRNELCFDTKTLATKELNKYKLLNNDEKELIKTWDSILKEAKKTDNYNKKLSYGHYQIEIELNTFDRDENNKIDYHYPTLNGELENLKRRLKAYYIKYIMPKLFKYELLK